MTLKRPGKSKTQKKSKDLYFLPYIQKWIHIELCDCTQQNLVTRVSLKRIARRYWEVCLQFLSNKITHIWSKANDCLLFFPTQKLQKLQKFRGQKPTHLDRRTWSMRKRPKLKLQSLMKLISSPARHKKNTVHKVTHWDPHT